MSLGSLGNKNLEQLFLWTPISCICMVSDDNLQRQQIFSLLIYFKQISVYSYVPVMDSVSHVLPVDIHTDLISINDGRLSVELFVI